MVICACLLRNGLLLVNLYSNHEAYKGGGMIGLEILVKIQPEKRAEFLQAFEMLKTIDLLWDKRVELQLFEQVKEPNTFLWLEHWHNDASLADYYQEAKFRAMMGAIDILGQLIQKREFFIKEEKGNA